MRRGIFALLCLLWPALAAAQQLPTIVTAPEGLRPLVTLDEVRPFTAVGRLDTGRGYCTATLITSDLVLTAAHCLFDEDSAPVPGDSMVFNAGLRNGTVAAQSRIQASFVHPGYDHGRPDGTERVRFDLAILRLERPILNGSIEPLQPGATGASRGDEVTVVSYGRGREQYASIEEGCEVLATRGDVFEMDCSIVPGSSGSPVMVRSSSGYRIVSVVSSSAHRLLSGQQVSLAAPLQGEIHRLMQMAGARQAGASAQSLPQLRTLGGDGGREATGARFVRP
ncbi:MAG: trypsin-like peptidase domain-containing protein [Pseudomonadota bacterium]